MITALTAITPLMMAAPVDQPATMPEAPAAYNWENQNANELISEDELKNGAYASFSILPGPPPQPSVVDDCRLC